MLTTAALILIVTSKVVLGQDDRVPVDGQIYKLDMALDSVDDWYYGCEKEMESLVRSEYLRKDISADISKFGKALLNSIEEMPAKLNIKHKLKIYHLIAIYMYSYSKPTKNPELYKEFNHDVRTGKQKYEKKTYRWYSLHFLLTEAIEILKKTQQECKLTYRGTKLKFNENVLNTEIRFGSFASSSVDREIAKRFGTKSCFEILTCQGADVSEYSMLSYEKEVLIPPYEKFKVTEIKKGAWCNTVFVLKSSGLKSTLNCAMALAKPQIYHNVSLSQWRRFTKISYGLTRKNILK
nr:ecto-ADP-ribosyltransferase 5-like [Misgurnus anguillicaudatus]